VTPTRCDIDALALDRALAPPPSSEEEIDIEEILEVLEADPGALEATPPRASRIPAVRRLPKLPPPSHAPQPTVDVAVGGPPSARTWAPSSFAPVTVEEAPSLSAAESNVHAAAAPRSRRLRTAGIAWGIGLVLLAAGMGLGVALGTPAAKVVAHTPPPMDAAEVDPPEVPGVVSTTQARAMASTRTISIAAPTFDVTSLPQAPVGTVSLAAAASSHRLYVDGVVAPSGSAVVKCGKHLVKVGSKGRAQMLDVACGGETIVGL
jgi:hypothetical protein